MSRKFSLSLLALGLTSPFTSHAAQAQTKPVLTTLHRFSNNGYGTEPAATLTLGTDGCLYGTTFETTTAFKMTPSGQFTTLHKFSNADGVHLLASLTQGTDGAFYGVAQDGGINNHGTAFRITSDGHFMVLHTFGTDGSTPRTTLLLAADGSFYGTTQYGGANGYGTVFHMTPNGTVTTMHSFRSSDGSYPTGRLAFDADGALYGTTNQGGTRNRGTAYRLATDGKQFSVLHSFTGSGGAYSEAGLTAGPDGALYGVTYYGGIVDAGVAYKITPSGVFTTLHKFSDDGHGAYPFAALTLGADGLFYGTTLGGGTTTSASPNGAGTVFSMTPAGQLTTLYKFHTAFDGDSPYGVMFGPDGALYSTTFNGGVKGLGTIYKLTLP